MNYCPIISFQRQSYSENQCMGKDCAFADIAGECLITQALQCYVSAERTAAAEKEEKNKIIDKFFDNTLESLQRTPSYPTPLSGYPYTIEPTSDCIIRSNDFVGQNGLQEGP